VSTRHFNNLTPAEAERLALLSEECGECIQAVGKILRHGYDSVHPEGKDKGNCNRDNLEREMGDILAAMQIMKETGDIDQKHLTEWREDKLTRVGKYLHHQPKDFL